MKYFRPTEFREWWELMSIDLLEVLDDFRDIWGAPVMISPHADALGRHGGRDDLSQHNVDKWGEVRAADLDRGGAVGRTSRSARAARPIPTTTRPWLPSLLKRISVRFSKDISSPSFSISMPSLFTWSATALYIAPVSR